MLLELVPYFQTLLTLSFKASLLILAILLVRAIFGKHLPPAWRHAIWWLVPLQLLLCVSIPSFLSVYNFVPQEQNITGVNEAQRSDRIPRQPTFTNSDLLELPTIEPEQNALPESEISLPTLDNAIEFADIPEFVDTFESPSISDSISEIQQQQQPRPQVAARSVFLEDDPFIPLEDSEELEPAIVYNLPNPIESPAKSLTPHASRLMPSLTFIWLTGCVLMFLVFLRQTLQCRRWMRTAEHVESEAVLHLFKECAVRMKVRTWLVIAESRNVSGPLLIGAIRPTLLLPDRLVESATPNQLRTVFLHELAHLKRWDVWTSWIMTFFLTLHWFNPLLWLAVRKMNADREEACDALALQTLKPSEHFEYGHALIDIAQNFVTPQKTPGLVGISETGKNLKRRIEMIKQIGTWKLRWKIFALLAVLFIGVATMTDAQERTPKKSLDELQAEINRLQAELEKHKEAENKAKPKLTLKVYPLRETDPMTALEVCKTLFGDPPPPGVKLSAEIAARRIIVLGSEAEHKKVKDALKQLEETTESLKQEAEIEDVWPDAPTSEIYPPLLGFYELVNFEVLKKDLESLLKDLPNVHVNIDMERRLYISGMEADQEKIATRLERLRQESLTKPAYGVYSLRDVFGFPDKAEQFLQSVLSESPDAKIAVDKSSGMFIVFGNKAAQDQIQSEIARSPQKNPKFYADTKALPKELLTGEYNGTFDGQPIQVSIFYLSGVRTSHGEYGVTFYKNDSSEQGMKRVIGNGNVVFNSNKSGKTWLAMSMKFGDSRIDEATAAIEMQEKPDGFFFNITIPKSKDWPETRVSKKMPFLTAAKGTAAPVSAAKEQPQGEKSELIEGSYLMEDVDLDALVKQIQPLLPNVKMVANKNTSCLVVTASEAEHETVKKTILEVRRYLEQKKALESLPKYGIYSLRDVFGFPDATEQFLQNILAESPDAKIAVDKLVTETFIVVARKPIQDKIRAELAHNPARSPEIVDNIQESQKSIKTLLPGTYLGTVGEKRISLHIFHSDEDRLSITIEEKGQTDQVIGETYSGSANLNFNQSGKTWLAMRLAKTDNTGRAARQPGRGRYNASYFPVTATVEVKEEENGFTFNITIPKNENIDWGEIRLTKQIPFLAAAPAKETKNEIQNAPSVPQLYEAEKQASPRRERRELRSQGVATNLIPFANSEAEKILPGRYLGTMDDPDHDRVGIEIGQPTNHSYPITLYVGGLPDEGFDPKNGIKIVGKGNYGHTVSHSHSSGYSRINESLLQIDFTHRFEGSKEERLRHPLQDTAKIEWKYGDDHSTLEIMIPKSDHLHEIHVSKVMLPVLNSSDIGALLPFLPKNYPIFELQGEYSGQSGTQTVGFRFAPKFVEKGQDEDDFDKLDGKAFIVAGNGGTFKISDSLLSAYIYEGRAKSRGHLEPNTYVGTLQYTGPNELELRTEKYYDEDQKEQPVPEAMKSIPVKVAWRQGDDIALEIPKGGVRVTKIVKRLPAWADTQHLAEITDPIAKNLPGEYVSIEGDDRFSVKISEQRTRGGNNPGYMIEFHEKNGGEQYHGVTWYVTNPNNETKELVIHLEKKYDGTNQGVFIERAAGIHARIDVKDENVEITIPKTAYWNEFRISKEKPAQDSTSTTPEVPKNFPLMKFSGYYSGTIGNDPIDMQFFIASIKKDNPDFDRLDSKEFVAKHDGETYKISDKLIVSIFKGKKDRRIVGWLHYVNPNELKLEITKFYDDLGREKPVPEPLKSLYVRVIYNGESPILEIPPNELWNEIRVERPTREIPDRPQQTLVDENKPVGDYLGWEGDDRIGIRVGKPTDGKYPITIYEDGLPGQGFDPNDDDRYEGTTTYDWKTGRMEIELTKKFDGTTEKPVENVLRKLSATTENVTNWFQIVIPKNEKWDEVRVSKEKTPQNPTPQNSVPPAPVRISPQQKSDPAAPVRISPQQKSDPAAPVRISPQQRPVQAASAPNLPDTAFAKEKVDKIMENSDLTRHFIAKILLGKHLAMKGDKRIGIEIGEPENNLFPITIYENGLPGDGFDPQDDAKYLGVFTYRRGEWRMQLGAKFEGRKEKRVETALQNLEPQTGIGFDKNDMNIVFVIPKNQEWDEIKLVVKTPILQALTDRPATPDDLPGKYLGWEGDDRIGVRIEKPENDVFAISFYENGKRFDPNDDDYYLGTAKFQDGKLEINLSKKIDENVEKPVEKVLQKLTANVFIENGTTHLSIVKNSEWDEIIVSKTTDSATQPKKETEVSQPLTLPSSPETVSAKENVKKETNEPLEKHVFFPVKLSGQYLGTEGNDRIGVEIGKSVKGVYPITFYEDGLPGEGYNPNDDDKYVGTMIFDQHTNEKTIRLTQKFEGRKEKKVETALRELIPKIEVNKEDGIVYLITIPKNSEWDEVRLSKKEPFDPESLKPFSMVEKLPGNYLGWEDGDRIGIIIKEPKDGVFPILFYENGLPGKGFNPSDDDRYEGTATFKNGKLEIQLSKKFDENIEQPVEKALQNITGRVSIAHGKVQLTIAENSEGDEINVTKTE